jgi:hypothetical protein
LPEEAFGKPWETRLDYLAERCRPPVRLNNESETWLDVGPSHFKRAHNTAICARASSVGSLLPNPVKATALRPD